MNFSPLSGISRESHFSTVGSRFQRVYRFAIASLAVCFQSTAYAQTSPTDPTAPNSSTALALEALHRSTGTLREQELPEEVDVGFAGVVLRAGEKDTIGMVILKIDDTFYPAIEGQTVRSGKQNVMVGDLNRERVQIVNHKTGATRDFNLGANRGLATEKDRLALIELYSVPLSLVAQSLSYVTDTQIVVSKEASEQKVTLFLRNVTTEQALSTLVATHQLYASKIRDSDITRLQTVEEFARGSATYQDERVKVFTLRFPNARDIALTIRDLYGDRVRLSERVDESENVGESLIDDLQNRLERFDIIAGRGQGIGNSNQGGSGGSSSRVSSGDTSFTNRSTINGNNNSRNNRDSSSERGLSQIEEELKRLGSVDAARVEAIRDARADIFVSLIDRQNKLLVRTRGERTMEEIETLVEELDQPAQLVFLEVRILRVSIDDGLDTAVDWAFEEGENDGNGIGGGRFAPTDPAVNGPLLFRYLDDALAAEIRFLQEKDKLTVLGQPSLLVANNEVSRIFIGEKVPMLTGFGNSATVITDSGNTVNFANAEYGEEDVGSTLLITPNINDDGTVELRLLQEESRVVPSGANVLVPDGQGGFDERAVDIVTSQTVSGAFVSKNRRTFAIGGLITETIEEQRSQIPILGDLPLIGRAFRSQKNVRRRDEIILLVTPTIIEDGDQGEATTKKYLEDRSFFPNPMPNEGNLDVYRKEDVLLPRVPERPQPFETGSELFNGTHGPRKKVKPNK